MKQKSIKNIREEFKNKGIFYTPPELAKKLLQYVDIEPKTVYDPTCGAGNLLKVFGDNVKKYGQELDPEQLELIDIPNFTGHAGDTLLDDGFKGMKFDCIVANPPFSVKYQPELLKDDERFADCGTLPPPSKADWAFMLHILHHLNKNGVAVILEFPGILYRGNKEGKVRRWFIENNYIDRVVSVDGNVFEDTSIATCIIVLKKNKETTDIIFEDKNKEVAVRVDDIASNDYSLSPQLYIPYKQEKEEININDVNKEIINNVLKNVMNVINNFLYLRKAFPEDEFYLDMLHKGLKEEMQKLEDVVYRASREAR